MDLRKIKKLIDLLEESNLSEIEIKEGEESVRLSRAPVGPPPPAAAPSMIAVPRTEPVMPMQSPVQAATGGRAAPGDAADAGPDLPEGHVVASPLGGTYHASPAPDQPAVAAGGQAVAVGHPPGLVE